LAASDEERPFSVVESFFSSSATGRSFSSEGVMPPKLTPYTILLLSIIRDEILQSSYGIRRLARSLQTQDESWCDREFVPA
jgi:hypothetical protein